MNKTLEKIVSTSKKVLRNTIILGGMFGAGYYTANEIAKEKKFNEQYLAGFKIERVYMIPGKGVVNKIESYCNYTTMQRPKPKIKYRKIKPFGESR